MSIETCKACQSTVLSVYDKELSKIQRFEITVEGVKKELNIGGMCGDCAIKAIILEKN